jgi:polyhydroxyalkanoate synthesis regulator phasin
MMDVVANPGAPPAHRTQPSVLRRDLESAVAEMKRATDRSDVRELKGRVKALRRQLKALH